MNFSNLKMPEEEGEDEADPDAHYPGSKHKHQKPEVCQSLKWASNEIISRIWMIGCHTLTTAPNSGIDRNWLAKTFILSACSFNLWFSFLAVGWNCQELEDQKIKSASSLKLLPIGVRAVLVHFCALSIIEKENQQVKEARPLYRFTG